MSTLSSILNSNTIIVKEALLNLCRQSSLPNTLSSPKGNPAWYKTYRITIKALIHNINTEMSWFRKVANFLRKSRFGNMSPTVCLHIEHVVMAQRIRLGPTRCKLEKLYSKPAKLWAQPEPRIFISKIKNKGHQTWLKTILSVCITVSISMVFFEDSADFNLWKPLRHKRKTTS